VISIEARLQNDRRADFRPGDPLEIPVRLHRFHRSCRDFRRNSSQNSSQVPGRDCARRANTRNEHGKPGPDRALIGVMMTDAQFHCQAKTVAGAENFSRNATRSGAPEPREFAGSPWGNFQPTRSRCSTRGRSSRSCGGRRATLDAYLGTLALARAELNGKAQTRAPGRSSGSPGGQVDRERARASCASSDRACGSPLRGARRPPRASSRSAAPARTSASGCRRRRSRTSRPAPATA